MSWQASSLAILAVVIGGGFVWFERSRPSARIVAAVAAMAALGIAGRLAFAPIPNVVATTDVAMLAGYTLGGGPGFAVGALSGLVSNFWLGQGPWTPWQMAGWGMVGIAGAAMAALSGRRLGRLGLAVCGALAGLAYGALLDLSVMVTFGGEQSLDRYLALSARGVPFNIAHAVGNFVLMFAAGPAMVRMLDRYRERFAYRWSDAPLSRAAICAVLALCLLAPLLSPQAGQAKGGRSAAADWLVGAQNSDGGYGTAPGTSSSVGMTGWAMLGLEAAGTNPLDVGVSSPVAYLSDNATAIKSTADLERSILALEGAGENSRSFAGRDLVSELRKRQGKDGSFEDQVNLTAFAILAQRAAGIDGSHVSGPVRWLDSIENRDGGWGSTDGAESEPDSTGAVLQAMAVAPGGDDELAAGARWLEGAQHGDGGWSLTAGGSSNTQSTAWAVQGLIAAGKSPGAIAENGSSGPDYIARRQSGDGHYSYSGESDQTPVWVTAQGLSAIGREPFPIEAVERDPVEAAAPSTSSSPAPTTSGGLDDLALGGSDGTGLPGTTDGPLESSPSAQPNAGNGSDPSGSSGPQLSNRKRLAANPPGAAGLESFVQSAATPAQLPTQSSPLPATPVFLAGLGLLAVGMAAGFVRYRRRVS